ncbi:hypothetical protein [Micromonospora sp. AKA38]|uniref:hypothetical protein n=1 Tax=Micromonospora sp. AKA38 TaxID=2733861 RepID=UPI0022BB2282|nr:hypothetical protein [Micromonospora sp. AKA38]GHJ12990.1 hypothetical protein TPA0908_09850 [Micromonospora sp. AKA38]
MDGADLLLAALAVGATTGVTDATSALVRDAATNLRARVRQRLTRDGQAALRSLEADPTQPGDWQVRLVEDLTRTGLDRDQQILDLARDLLARAEATGGRTDVGPVDLRGAKGVQFGTANTQHNTFT